MHRPPHIPPPIGRLRVTPDEPAETLPAGADPHRSLYTILSCSAFTGQKRTKLKKAIAAAVRTGGGNPSRLAAIEILDANKIAEWANCHPSVALWLAKHSRRRSLAGFQTHESWGKSADIPVLPGLRELLGDFLQ